MYDCVLFDIDGVLVTRHVCVSDKWGWGVNFGAELNLPMPDTTLGFQATYTDGASQYHGTVATRSLIFREFDDDVFPFATVTASSEVIRTRLFPIITPGRVRVKCIS
jgi:hypothetical protein